MPLRIKCPTGHTLIVPDDRAGRTLKCPRCDRDVVVPLGESDAAGQALLSVLAEGIPAVTLAAGSLRVATVPAPPPQNTLPVIDPPFDRPPKLPRFKAAPPPPAVKPKSRALPTPPRVPVVPMPVPTTTKPKEPEPTTPEPKGAEPIISEPVADVPPSTPSAAEPEAQGSHAPAAVEVAAAENSPVLYEPVIHDVAFPPDIEPLPEPTIPLPIEPEPQRASVPAIVAESTGTPACEPAEPEPIPAPQPVPEPEPPAASLQPADESVLHCEPIEPVANEPQPHAPLAVSDDHDEAHPPPIVDDHLAPPPFVPMLSTPAAANLAADAARTLAAYQLALALAAAALFSVVPAVWDVVEFFRSAESIFVARWALALFFLGVVQLAYAVYLFQLPDWSSVWVVTIVSLALAGVYAAVLGLVLLSPPDGFLVGPSGLQLADKLAGGKAALWCLCMISVSTILAFFAGRLGASWHRAEMMLRLAALPAA
jgi:hypothetical protein